VVDSRWWAVAIPSLAVVALVYVYVALAGYNQSITPSFNQLECITGMLLNGTSDTDSYARITTEPYRDRFRGTNGVLDLPARLVCETLYLEEDEREVNGAI
jgi:PIG-P